jgi:hypothetical protein
VLEDAAPAVEAIFVVETDVEMLEEWEFEGEVDDDIGVAEVDETVVVADELCAAEFETAVLVCCSPTTPMMVCAVPSET